MFGLAVVVVLRGLVAFGAGFAFVVVLLFVLPFVLLFVLFMFMVHLTLVLFPGGRVLSPFFIVVF